ncbi:MAG: SRPBCC domain-containing protein [Chloroflexi bacterium]|nr:SRPBCC domain-containing protein [Chloroflexota bacterium]
MNPTRSSTPANANEGQLTITRIFDAPRELVWKAWTEPERFMRWWGPKDFTSPRCEIDLRVGGRYLWCMRWPDGRDSYTTGEYREIVPLERLVYTDCFADKQGNAVPATHYGLGADFPFETQVTLTFEDCEGGTKMTLTHAGIPGAELSEMTGASWNQSFDKLATSLR